MTDPTLPFETIARLSERIHSGELRPVRIVEALLARIQELDPKLHSFSEVTADRALTEARAAEAALHRGQDLGTLHGIPYAVKDLFDVEGIATAAGSRLLARNIASADSTAVRKLAASGMVLLGKNHTIQLAYGLVGINSDFGTPHNPWRADPHAPGGSSSGGAVAVSAGLAPVSLGTDTGGSVRVPAALNGIVGLKTTVGRVSRAGVYPLSWTFDSAGPLARTVEDAALVYRALQGPDPLDETTSKVAPDDVLSPLKRGVKGLRVAFAETLFFDDVDPEIEKAVRATGDVFRGLGARVERMEVPEITALLALPKRGLFIAAEACANNRDLLENHFDELDPLVSHRMALGRNLAAYEYFTLQRAFAALRDQVRETLRDVDALLVPTTMAMARPLEAVRSPMEAYQTYNQMLNRNAGLGNILGLCGISLPCGFTSGGLPIGLMIYAKPFEERTALRVGYAYEQATEWHKLHPDLTWASASARPGDSKAEVGSPEPAPRT